MPRDDDARATALRLLARREHSAVELAGKLRARGFEEPAVERCIAELAGERLLSDERFVESFVRSRIDRGQGPYRIRAELQERGVAAEAIDAGLEQAEVEWAALAAEQRRRRFGAERPSEFKERARQARFLQYRGFSAEQIRAALESDDWE